MDIKWKNSRSKRVVITVGVLLIATIVNLCFFSLINIQVEKNKSETAAEEKEINRDAVWELYHGCYVLYLEQKEQEAGNSLKAYELYVKDYETASESDLDQVEQYLLQWSGEFENYRSKIDYYVTDGVAERKNTNRHIAEVLAEKPNEALIREEYETYMILSFDEKGALDIKARSFDGTSAENLVKSMERADRQESLFELIADYAASYETSVSADRIRSFTVVYGIPYGVGASLPLYFEDFSNNPGSELADQAIWLYFATIGSLLILVILMTNKKIWPELTFERKGNWYVLEAACVGVILVCSLYDQFCNLIHNYQLYGVQSIRNLIMYGSFELTGYFIEIAAGTFAIYGIAYCTMLAFRPLFSIGFLEYVMQYSLIYQVFPWLKKRWHRFAAEVEHIDFSEKSTRTLIKVVVINFLILAIILYMWLFGMFGLLIYSLVLFYLIKRYYDRIARDYQILMRATSRIAEGDLDSIITEDIGVFEPFKGELFKIRTGLKRAIDEETRSQRTKTELITNVSHDLKTPLTAITTYVELLKKEDITEEERRSYIDTLDRKALRLKVLIEDLFEVSKASSNSITLNLIEVDVVNLMKQVSIEHADSYEAAGIELRWSVPEEKVLLFLDNQKTYRIFENLFVNIQKYAMPNSRVYIEVARENGRVRIVIKNMSAFELNVRPEELTDRFVRGDASRNTEGSGLGLAIAKSFTEAQKGSFDVAVDGDLFKVTIMW